MNKRKLPIGIDSFSKICEEGYYYVDKTAFIERLLSEGEAYFLSRPRRFGKSLFLNTLKALFEGRESLFKGLYVHDRWDWSQRNPVIHLNFAGGNFSKPDSLPAELDGRLLEMEERENTHPSRPLSPSGRFRHLIKTLHATTGRKVVVLVDEYDKPILDALKTPEVARANRDYMRGFFGIIKETGEHLRFVFLTGVSKFSKVSLFSGLNNLIDISLEPDYSAICGYTERDLDEVFGDQFEDLDRDRVREWYNGYSWLGAERLYNPFDILLLLRRREFGAWWFESGTPTFLIETLTEARVASISLEGMIASESLLSTFDVDDMAPEALLFQTGYLTIQAEQNEGGKRFFKLGYPNREVKQGLNENLLRWMVRSHTDQQSNSARLPRLLIANDWAGLESLFKAFYASIPHQWLINNDIANYEGYYASVFYSYFASLGLEITVEDSSLRGRADMLVRFNDQHYLFEFKVVESTAKDAALGQLKSKGYANKYRHLGQPIHLIGVEFSKQSKTITQFSTETI